MLTVTVIHLTSATSPLTRACSFTTATSFVPRFQHHMERHCPFLIEGFRALGRPHRISVTHTCAWYMLSSEAIAFICLVFSLRLAWYTDSCSATSGPGCWKRPGNTNDLGKKPAQEPSTYIHSLVVCEYDRSFAPKYVRTSRFCYFPSVQCRIERLPTHPAGKFSHGWGLPTNLRVSF